MNGDNLLIWDGREHSLVNYNLYKHLCAVNNVQPKTDLYNMEARFKELF